MEIIETYDYLLADLGPSFWWPAESPFEVMLGAVLTQNTNWKNVERAIDALKKNDLLDPEALGAVPEEDLAELIRSSGYYRQKARKLRALVEWFSKYEFSLQKIQAHFPKGRRHPALRAELLEVFGIGPETADSILCYALELPCFVVDAYTKRLWQRLGRSALGYDEIQREVHEIFEAAYPNRELVSHYNEFHALIVRHSNTRCKKRSPKCRDCSLADFCERESDGS